MSLSKWMAERLFISVPPIFISDCCHECTVLFIDILFLPFIYFQQWKMIYFFKMSIICIFCPFSAPFNIHLVSQRVIFNFTFNCLIHILCNTINIIFHKDQVFLLQAKGLMKFSCYAPFAWRSKIQSFNFNIFHDLVFLLHPQLFLFQRVRYRLWQLSFGW